MKQSKSSLIASLAVLVYSTAAVSAGSSTKEVTIPPAPPAPPVVTGTLNLNYNTHFTSYGFDIWRAGQDFGDRGTFNPSIQLNFDLGSGFRAILGTWWDVNSNADSNIGNAIQEVDVYGGFGYTTGPLTFTLLYQEWMYASQSERIVDFKIAYANFLNPSVTFHGRVDSELPFDNGLATVLGIAPRTSAGPVTLTFPFQVAAQTDNFHGGGSGFSFASGGITASVPVSFMPGKWSLNAGLVFYYTNDKVIPVNVDESFLTGSIGLGLAF